MPQEEINRLAEWAEGGAPEGEPEFLLPDKAVKPWRPTAAPAGRDVSLRDTLAAPVSVLAIRAGAEAGKTWAETPAGEAIPLAWITGAAKPAWMIFREPVRLPAGTRIHGHPLQARVR